MQSKINTESNTHFRGQHRKIREDSRRSRKIEHSRDSFKLADKRTIQRNKHISEEMYKKINKKAIYLARRNKYC
mgnify:CR=1 FL=1